MELTFSHFCRNSQLHEPLRRQIDRCAAGGRSYELPRCQMPEGCFPSFACVGFFRRTDGAYVIYWRPSITYRGQNRQLAELFGQCLWSFPGFDGLSARLLSLNGGQPTRADGAARYETLRRELSRQIFGQENAVTNTAFRLSHHLGKTAPARPLSLMLHGPTGVGKSELAKAIPGVLARCGEPWQFVWTDLNTYTQPHSVHRLTGAPPGYVGYEDEAVLTAVRSNPRTVFLFDELDKAHPEVLKVLMSILDEGRCTASRPGPDGRRELDFRRCVLLFTTNLDLTAPVRTVGFSAEPARKRETTAPPADLAERLFSENEAARRAMTRHGVLREIAGRFSGFVAFSPLSPAAQRQVIAQQAVSLGAEYGLRIERVEPSAVEALLPPGEAFSMRSARCILEARLAPLYGQAVGGETIYQLSLSSGRLSLSAVSGSADASSDSLMSSPPSERGSSRTLPSSFIV